MARKNGKKRSPNSQSIRERLGIERADWSRILNVSTATVYRWENGEHPPTGLAAVVLHGIDQAIEKVGPEVVRDRLILGVAHLVYEGLRHDRA